MDSLTAAPLPDTKGNTPFPLPHPAVALLQQHCPSVRRSVSLRHPGYAPLRTPTEGGSRYLLCAPYLRPTGSSFQMKGDERVGLNLWYLLRDNYAQFNPGAGPRPHPFNELAAERFWGAPVTAPDMGITPAVPVAPHYQRPLWGRMGLGFPIHQDIPPHATRVPEYAIGMSSDRWHV